MLLFRTVPEDQQAKAKQKVDPTTGLFVEVEMAPVGVAPTEAKVIGC